MNELTETKITDRRTEDIYNNNENHSILTRHPRPEDGQEIWRLVKETGVLDLNSAYCYLLLCKQFSNTCMVAEISGELAGFVTAYKIPDNETTLFIWQTGIAKHLRGKGIAKKLILELLAMDSCINVEQIQATVSPSNTASMALFRALARNLNTKFTEEEYFDSTLFPGQQHEKENLVTVGPFNR